MKRRDPLPRLVDIRESIEGIEAILAGTPFETYRDTWHIQRAVERGIEIISEASRAVPKDLKERHPEIPWRQISGIGNILRHEYAHISPKIIWEVTQVHLPPLKQAIDAMIAHVEAERTESSSARDGDSP